MAMFAGIRVFRKHTSFCDPLKKGPVTGLVTVQEYGL